MRQGVMYAATRGMLLDRVFSIPARQFVRAASLSSRHRTDPAEVRRRRYAVAHSHFIVARIMHDGVTSLFATGRYLDRIDVSRTPYRFIERIVVLDSDKIDTLLAIPL